MESVANYTRITDPVGALQSPVLRVVESKIKKAAGLLKELVPGLGIQHGDDQGCKSPPIDAGSDDVKKVGHSHHRRPFFIIGHMVNSIEEVDEYLARRSNALESDIEFDKNGTVLGTFHGTPCDCFRGCFKREQMASFLEHVRNVSSFPHSKYKGKMILLFLDLKTTRLPDGVKVTAGVNLAQKLMDHLWKDVPHEDRINVLMSIGYARDRDVIRGAVAYFRQKGDPRVLEKLGFDVGMNDPLNLISRMYRRLGIRENRWQGDGLTNCMRFIMPVDRLLKAIKWRDTKKGYMDKVYHWTIDLPYFIRKSIRHGVDGIVTNRPENVRKVVESAMFRNKLKVADANDSPWTRFYESPQDDEEDTDTDPIMLGAE
ncbi:dermonecrotic toxin SPH-like [Haemaphysalis longicornis]